MTSLSLFQVTTKNPALTRLKNRAELLAHLMSLGASLVAQLVKNSPAMWETWVQSLGWEDPLEKGMTAHCSISMRVPWTEEPGGLHIHGVAELDMTEPLALHSCH